MTSKYDRLADHLATLGAATIILSFAEVEAIVGSPLPATARHDKYWWVTTSLATAYLAYICSNDGEHSDLLSVSHLADFVRW